MSYYNAVWKNYGLVELHLEKLWVTITPCEKNEGLL